MSEGGTTIIIGGDQSRWRVKRWAEKAPSGTRIIFKEAKRTLPQNDRMWAMLTDVSRQQEYHGLRLSPEDWKLIFLDALSHELRIVPNLSGTGFVNLGRSSSKLSKSQMSDLMELISAYCAEHGIVLSEREAERAA